MPAVTEREEHALNDIGTALYYHWNFPSEELGETHRLFAYLALGLRVVEMTRSKMANIDDFHLLKRGKTAISAVYVTSLIEKGSSHSSVLEPFEVSFWSSDRFAALCARVHQETDRALRAFHFTMKGS